MKKGIFKKLVVAALVGVMSIGLISCGNSNADSKDPVQAIKDKGKVVVGLSADFAPYEFHAMINGKDETVGFDINIAKQIASDMGVELEIKEMDFDALISALKAGQIDMIISGMNPTDERKEQVDFSDIYYESQHAVIVNKNDVDKYKEASALDGKKIGVQLGSTQEQLAKEKIKNAELTSLANVNNVVLELKSGKVDAVVTDQPVAEMVVKTNPELALCGITYKEESGGNAIAVQKGSDELVKQVNTTIKNLKDSGKLKQFLDDATDQGKFVVEDSAK